MNINWHLLSLSEVSQSWTPPAGLDEKCKDRQTQYVKMKSTSKKKEYCLRMIFNQLSNFMILIPYPGGNCLRIMGDLTDTIIILIIIVVNAAIGLCKNTELKSNGSP
jgi:Ca2+-transporting ATPase